MPLLPAQPHRRLPARPLAAAFATLFACVDASATASVSTRGQATPDVVSVGNCNDSGSGSLRDAVLHADDGDTIDLTHLTCSTISLSTGGIVIGAPDLTLEGPGKDALTITTAGHTGTGVIYDIAHGTLKVHGLTVSFGGKYPDSGRARGGCIFSAGDVEIIDSHVYGCSARSTGSGAALGGAVYASGDMTLISSEIDLCGATGNAGGAKGGGVFAGGNLTIAYSSISGCRVATNTAGYGGGAFVGGNLIAKYSTFSDNTIDDATTSIGGGLNTRGNAIVLLSTISGNHANFGGGAVFSSGTDGDAVTIVASTISGNAAKSAGGASSELPLSLFNSTIAFNTAQRAYSVPIGYSQSAGLGVRTSPVRIESSIIANNIALGPESVPRDVGGEFAVTITGSNNLIGHVAQGAPPGTISTDPLLGPLRNNRGMTATHALLPGSPAINVGNNVRNFSTDQRGIGFPRVLGGVPDIGAYEVDPDRIFDDGFD